MKTKEEKGMEKIEEQRVIDAKIRMRQQEILDEEERVLKRQQLSSSSQIREAVDCDGGSVAVLPSLSVGEYEDIISFHDSHASPLIRIPPNTGLNQNEDFDLDLEEIMVAEAVRQSIQESGRWRNQRLNDVSSENQFVNVASRDQYVYGYVSPVTTSLAESSSSLPMPSFSGGHAHAIAPGITEHPQDTGESSARQSWCFSSFSVLPGFSRFNNTVEQEAKYYPPAEHSADVSSNKRMEVQTDGEWDACRNIEGSEAGTSYPSHIVAGDAGESEYTFPSVPEPLVPQSFEEQMRLAMAVSTTDARGISTLPRVTWE